MSPESVVQNVPPANAVVHSYTYFAHVLCRSRKASKEYATKLEHLVTCPHCRNLSKIRLKGD